jgi:hypothetical protein
MISTRNETAATAKSLRSKNETRGPEFFFEGSAERPGQNSRPRGREKRRNARGAGGMHWAARFGAALPCCCSSRAAPAAGSPSAPEANESECLGARRFPDEQATQKGTYHGDCFFLAKDDENPIKRSGAAGRGLAMMMTLPCRPKQRRSRRSMNADDLDRPAGDGRTKRIEMRRKEVKFEIV